MVPRRSGAPPGLSPGEGGATPEERRALDDLFSVTYEELRRLASSVRRDDPSSTLTPTALVNEAWLKLADSPWLGSTSPLHFKRVAARAMRQVLVGAAREKLAEKRGGGEFAVTLDEAAQASPVRADELVALDEALTRLANLDERQARVVELRYFAGLTAEETAEALGISTPTVQRDWRAARAWLAVELRREA